MCVPLVMASCGAKKILVGDGSGRRGAPATKAAHAIAPELAFVQKVSDGKVYAENIVADMSLTARMGARTITVPGSLRMRRNEVIRLQVFIPLLGSEVGRIEFTPDYVLVVDRMHKQYIKGDYSQLDFLRENGLNFYALQALFWNQLLLPGATRVSEADLSKFKVKLETAGQEVPIGLDRGNMSYVWKADRTTGLISEAIVSYEGGKHGRSELVWTYGGFQPIGSRMFPAMQEFSFETTATDKVGRTSLRLDMNNLRTIAGWESRSSVSDKYKQMDAKDILGKLLNM